MRSPTTYRLDVRILALDAHGVLVAGHMGGVELTAEEYDACDLEAMTERVTKPATAAAMHGIATAVHDD